MRLVKHLLFRFSRILTPILCASGLTACGSGTPPPQTLVLADTLATGAVHPFIALWGGHCAGTYFAPPGGALFRARAGTLYFQGTTDGADSGLWATDGTAAGTRLLASSTTYRIESGARFLREILPTDQGVFFALDPPCIFQPMPPYDPTPRPGPLWWTDGQGRAELVLTGYQVQGLVQSGDRLFFGAKGADLRTGLWSLSLANRQPTEVLHFENVGGAAAVGTRGIVFSATLSGGDTTAWFSDGTPAGTHDLGQACPGYPPQFVSVSVGSLAYFVCDSALALTDGTPQGTRLVPGAPSHPTGSFSGLVNFGGRLAFFFRPDAGQGLVQLWITDGSAAGTRQLASFSVKRFPQPGLAHLVVADKLDFVVDNTLWRSDGTPGGTAAVVDLPPVSVTPDTSYSHPGGRLLGTVGDRLIVVMNDAEPWEVRGTQAARIALDPTVSNIVEVVTMPDRVYYSAAVTTSPLLPALRAWTLVGE